jgi:hypothetical protein
LEEYPLRNPLEERKLELGRWAGFVNRFVSQQKYKFVVLLQIKLLFKALEAVFIGLLTIITKYFQIHYN